MNVPMVFFIIKTKACILCSARVRVRCLEVSSRTHVSCSFCSFRLEQHRRCRSMAASFRSGVSVAATARTFAGA